MSNKFNENGSQVVWNIWVYWIILTQLTYQKLLNILFFAMLGLNATVKSTFFSINVLWVDKNNRCLVESIKRIIVVKTHSKLLL